MNPAGQPPRIQVVEDDPVIGRLLQDGLTAHGYPTRWSTTGAAGLTSIREHPPDVLLLDLGLPDLDGTEVARVSRTEQPELVIIILTARGDDIDVVQALDSGADDYLVKPVSLAVLLARLRTRLRHPPTGASPSASALRSGALRVDAAARRCYAGPAELLLRPKEFALLLELLRAGGRAVTREHLMSAVWQDTEPSSTKTLDVTMAALRRRLEIAAETSPRQDQLPTVTTLRGYGYRLDPPQHTDQDTPQRVSRDAHNP